MRAFDLFHAAERAALPDLDSYGFAKNRIVVRYDDYTTRHRDIWSTTFARLHNLVVDQLAVRIGLHFVTEGHL